MREKNGATIICGGKMAEEKGELYYEPTMIVDCTVDMKCFKQEIFGPIIPIIKFKDESDAVAMAHSHHTGLAGYVMSRDKAQIWRVTEALEVGMVGVNEQVVSTDRVAFGGIKHSRLGREGSVHGLDEYTEFKLVELGLE